MAKRFELLDALRAFAVLLVVVAHAGLGHMIPGGAGVTVFFTISGFIITYVVMREYEKTEGFDAKLFYAKRFIKLFPPLIVCIVIPTIIYGFAHPEVFGYLLAQIFFAYNWFAAFSVHGGLPGSNVTWSLGVEEQFYIGFAIIWIALLRWRRAKRHLFWISVVVALVSLGLRIYMASNGATSDRLYYGTDARLDSIAIGIVTCLMVMDWQHKQRLAQTTGGDKKPSAWASLAILFTGIVIFLVATAPRSQLWQDTGRYFFQSLGIALVISYAFRPAHNWLGKALEWLWSLRWIQVIGRASYSIYLVHVPSAILLVYLVPSAKELPLLALVLIKVALGVLLGLAVWQWIEKPVERVRPAILKKLTR